MFSGAGKSTLTKQLRHELAVDFLREYATRTCSCKGDGEPLVLALYCNLPALRNPLTDLMEETLSKVYKLSESQIKSLREKAQHEEILLVLLCDAVDELPTKFKNKSLYDTNDLEMWGNPLVFFFMRAEEASGTANDPLAYQRIFYPVKTDVAAMDTEEEARHFFEEVRIAFFNSGQEKLGQVREYLMRDAAIRLVRVFEEHGHEVPLQPRDLLGRDSDFDLSSLAEAIKGETLGTVTEGHTFIGCLYMAVASSTSGDCGFGGPDSPDNLESMTVSLNALQEIDCSQGEVEIAFQFFSCLLEASRENSKPDKWSLPAWRDAVAHHQKSSDQPWVNYKCSMGKLSSMPELRELAKTPYMAVSLHLSMRGADLTFVCVQNILVAIMPQLEGFSSVTIHSIKASIILELGEGLGSDVYEIFKKEFLRIQDSTSDRLIHDIQDALSFKHNQTSQKPLEVLETKLMKFFEKVTQMQAESLQGETNQRSVQV